MRLLMRGVHCTSASSVAIAEHLKMHGVLCQDAASVLPAKLCAAQAAIGQRRAHKSSKCNAMDPGGGNEVICSFEIRF